MSFFDEFDVFRDMMNSLLNQHHIILYIAPCRQLQIHMFYTCLPFLGGLRTNLFLIIFQKECAINEFNAIGSHN